jgi:hypothetical protein
MHTDSVAVLQGTQQYIQDLQQRFRWVLLLLLLLLLLCSLLFLLLLCLLRFLLLLLLSRLLRGPEKPQQQLLHRVPCFAVQNKALCSTQCTAARLQHHCN